MIVTYQKIFSYIEGAEEGSVTDVLRLWIADYMEKIREKVGSKKCWEERILYLVHNTDKADFKEESVWYSPDAYNKLDLQTCCKIIDYSNCWENDRKNGKWYERRKMKFEYSIPEVYNLDEDTADVVIREHIKYTKRKSLSYLREARNLKAHPKNIRESDEVRNSDLVHFIEGMKTFLSSLPMEQAPILKEPIQRLLVQLHEMWEVLPEDERDGTEWEVEDLIPKKIPAPKPIPKPVPKPVTVITKQTGVTKKMSEPKEPRVSTETPQYIIILVDESQSMCHEDMTDKQGNTVSRGTVVMEAIDTAFSDMIRDCLKSNAWKSYYYVSILGYNNDENVVVKDIFRYSETADDRLKNATIRPFVGMANSIVEEGWIHYNPCGETPMAAAFEEAFSLVKEWDNHQTWNEDMVSLVNEYNPDMLTFRNTTGNEKCSCAPIIISISDGRFDNKVIGSAPNEDLSPKRIINEMINYEYQNFSAPIVMNVCIAGGNKQKAIEFPAEEPQGDEYARHMYQLSSKLSNSMLACLREYERHATVQDSARAFIHNGTSIGLSTMLKVGTIGTRMGINDIYEQSDDMEY